MSYDIHGGDQYGCELNIPRTNDERRWYVAETRLDNTPYSGLYLHNDGKMYYSTADCDGSGSGYFVTEAGATLARETYLKQKRVLNVDVLMERNMNKDTPIDINKLLSSIQGLRSDQLPADIADCLIKSLKESHTDIADWESGKLNRLIELDKFTTIEPSTALDKFTTIEPSTALDKFNDIMKGI